MDRLSDPAAPPRPNPTAVLSTLERLAGHLDEIDLDAIDGEFYWRCCRIDLLLAVDNLTASVNRISGRERGRLTEAETGVLDAYDGLLNRFQPQFPNLDHHLEHADWVRLRDGWVSMCQTAATPPFDVGSRGFPWGVGSATRVELRVFSSGWTGAVVEQRIQSYIANPTLAESWGERFEPRPKRPAQSVSVHVDFRFVAAGAEVDVYRLNSSGSSTLPLALPHVLVHVGLPLPAPGIVAGLYDAVVIGDKKWNAALLGNANRQEKRVALRTWAVGLLLAAGRKVDTAMREVCAALQEPEVTQVQFVEDRRRLVERVPEAQPYLYQRPPRGAHVGRAKSH